MRGTEAIPAGMGRSHKLLQRGLHKTLCIESRRAKNTHDGNNGYSTVIVIRLDTTGGLCGM